MEKQNGFAQKILFVIVILFIQLGLAFESQAQKADDYPNKPIQVIIPWAAGTDVADRFLATYLEKHFGQPFVIVNKPGGGGVLGFTTMAKSKPDGYTLGKVTNIFGIFFLIYKNLEFDFDSFVPICAFSKSIPFLLVKSDSRWRTLKDFIAEAKKNPGKLRFGSIGVSSGPYLWAAELIDKAEIELTHIPYAGYGEILGALAGGHIDIAPCYGSLGQLKGGTVRALAIAEKERTQAYPDIPTLTELGYPVVLSNMRGYIVPKGTPKIIVNKLTEGIHKVLKENASEISENFKKTEEVMTYIGPDDFGKEWRTNFEYMRKVFEGIKKYK